MSDHKIEYRVIQCGTSQMRRHEASGTVTNKTEPVYIVRYR